MCEHCSILALEVVATMPMTSNPADRLVCSDIIKASEVADWFEQFGMFVEVYGLRVAELATEERLILNSMGMYRVRPNGISSSVGVHYYSVVVSNSVGDVLFSDVCATPMFATISAEWWRSKNFVVRVEEHEYDSFNPIFLHTESAIGYHYYNVWEYPYDYWKGARLGVIQRTYSGS